MKQTFLLVAIFLLFSGCKEDTPVNAVQNSAAQGSLFLKIDRENAPQNVQTITASLFRAGFTTLTSTVNIQSDTSASFSFSSVPVGEWGLKVDAKDAAGTVIYTGQTALWVSANTTTTVSLQLQAVTGQTGTVVILVSWGTTPNNKFIDYPLNPVLSPSGNQYDFGGLGHCAILLDNGVYKMWYHGLVNGGFTYMLYAESPDGKSWVRKNNGNPVFQNDTTLEWERGGISPGAVLKEGDTYKMFYIASTMYHDRYYTGLATSSDGISWTRVSSIPVLSPGNNESSVFANSVVKVNGTYYLYYTSKGTQGTSICLATSQNGQSFQKFSGNPVLTATVSWEGNGIYEPSVIYTNNKFMMIYTTVSDEVAAFGEASSADGQQWQKESHNPVFSKNNTVNGWGLGSIAYPSLLRTPHEYRIYYTGLNPASPKYKIGYTSRPL